VLCGKRLFLNERKNLSELCAISYALWKRDMESKKREAGILRKIKGAIIRVMYGTKLMDKKNTKELME